MRTVSFQKSHHITIEDFRCNFSRNTVPQSRATLAIYHCRHTRCWIVVELMYSNGLLGAAFYCWRTLCRFYRIVSILSIFLLSDHKAFLEAAATGGKMENGGDNHTKNPRCLQVLLPTRNRSSVTQYGNTSLWPQI